ncbi:MAG TPA: hypothetical protein VGJ07_23625 [Rugosimonospora sp.]
MTWNSAPAPRPPRGGRTVIEKISLAIGILLGVVLVVFSLSVIGIFIAAASGANFFASNK